MMSDYLTESRGPALSRFAIACTVLPIIAIFLRFWSRAINGRPETSSSVRFWWDDWLALASLPFALGTSSIIIRWGEIGLGRHLTAVPTQDVITGLEMLYVGYQVYSTAITLAKMSAVAFYERVFTRNNGKWWTWAIYFSYGWCLVVWLIVVFVDCLQCTPVEKAWVPTTPGHCVDIYKWWLAFGIMSITLDVWLLVLPMPLVWKLQLNTSRKLLLCGLFFCGYCIVAISLGRLIVIRIIGARLEEDINYYVVPSMFWLVAEPAVSIISICLPGIFTLVKRGMNHGWGALFTRKSFPSVYSKSAWPESSRGLTPAADSSFKSQAFATVFQRLEDHTEQEYYASICRGVSTSDSNENKELAENGIQVRKDLDIRTEERAQ